jgi:hypothetical protein
MIKLCGAKAKTNNRLPCRRVAMPNGRCHLHGGRSTGAKTKEGKERARLAILKHGRYTKAAKEEARRFRIFFKQCRENLKRVNV